MTSLVARQPLQPLSMSSMQRASRRLSARLQEKDDAYQPLNPVYTNGGPSAPKSNGLVARKGQETAAGSSKKRKMDYDEDDDGFKFTRVKKQKQKTDTAKVPSAPVPQDTDIQRPEPQRPKSPPRRETTPNEAPSEPAKRRRNKMSFSTPGVTEQKSVRRSKRLSNDNGNGEGSPPRTTRKKQNEDSELAVPELRTATEEAPADLATDKPLVPETTAIGAPAEDHSATKIALPFADTPVIRRNKAMREGKAGKGERRSSLGLRGRRASSLIESGNSNALPHSEVEIREFYKHIASESLPEPKRMRQLLTWCATRAMGEKPVGTDFEDLTVRQAAWIIQGELLKDFANKSAMSDWFSREDVPKPAVPLEERPHPKNAQNMDKIQELQEQIKRLRAERDSLESLHHTSTIEPVAKFPANSSSQPTPIDISLLSASDAALLDSLGSSSKMPSDLSTRLNSIAKSLGPSIDAFADGVHEIGQYRDAADDVASQTLAICADKLAQREREGRRRALRQEEARSPGRDLGSVLRGLSRIEG